MTAWSDLYVIGAQQHGIITAADARACGIPQSTLLRRTCSEGWERMHRGLWALPGSSDSPERRHQAAVFALGDRALLGRRSAGWLWGLIAEPPATVELLAPVDHPGTRLRGVKVVRSRTLQDHDARRRGGFPVTAIPRTLGDLAAVCPDDALLGYAIAACQRRLTTPGHLAAQYAAMRGSTGIGKLRRAAELLQDSRVDSMLERDIRLGLAKEGLPAPHPDPYPVRTPGGRTIHVDIAWPEHKVGLEVDGFLFHSSHQDLATDQARANQAAAAGWVILRVGWWRWHHDRRAFLEELAIVLRSGS